CPSNTLAWQRSPSSLPGCVMTKPSWTELPIDRDTVAGASWAQHNIEVANQFAGKWVVALVGQVIASGDDSQEVRVVAAQRLNRLPERLLVCAISNPADWFSDANV